MSEKDLPSFHHNFKWESYVGRSPQFDKAILTKMTLKLITSGMPNDSRVRRGYSNTNLPTGDYKSRNYRQKVFDYRKTMIAKQASTDKL